MLKRKQISTCILLALTAGLLIFSSFAGAELPGCPPEPLGEGVVQ